MEKYKRRYVKLLLQRTGVESVSYCVQGLKEMEKEARAFYAEDVSGCMGEDEFIEMMLIDGCFIIEFLFRCMSGKHDEFSFSSVTRKSLFEDLLLLENQLPISVLLKLFKTLLPQEESTEFIFQVFVCLYEATGQGNYLTDWDSLGKCSKHLLDFLHKFWRPPSRDHFMEPRRDMSSRPLPSATTLQGVGIKFSPDPARDLFDIKLNDKYVLHIPTLRVDYPMEKVLYNLLGYELNYCSVGSRYVTDYVMLMSSLVNSEKDVELLCKRQVILNRFATNEAVASMFKGLADSVLVFGYDTFRYRDIWERLRDRYDEKSNSWWKLPPINKTTISLSAGFLILLTGTQTVYAVLSYHRPQLV